MKFKLFFLLHLVIAIMTLSSKAQLTMNLYPDYDVAIGHHVGTNNANSNYQYASQCAAYSYIAADGFLNMNRALFHFDLSALPNGSVITEAFLNLRAYGPAGILEGHEGDSNYGLIERIIEDWSPSTVTWNNQPSTTDVHSVILENSANSLQNYLNIDVTDIIQDTQSTENHGFMLRLIDENPTNVLIFCSSDHPNSEKHPVLTIKYNVPLSISQVDSSGVEINLFPNPSNGLFSYEVKSKSNLGMISIQFISSDGKVMKELWTKETHQTIELTDFSVGTYIVNFVSESFKSTQLIALTY